MAPFSQPKHRWIIGGTLVALTALIATWTAVSSMARAQLNNLPADFSAFQDFCSGVDGLFILGRGCYDGEQHTGIYMDSKGWQYTDSIIAFCMGTQCSTAADCGAGQYCSEGRCTLACPAGSSPGYVGDGGYYTGLYCENLPIYDAPTMPGMPLPVQPACDDTPYRPGYAVGCTLRGAYDTSGAFSPTDNACHGVVGACGNGAIEGSEQCEVAPAFHECTNGECMCNTEACRCYGGAHAVGDFECACDHPCAEDAFPDVDFTEPGWLEDEEVQNFVQVSFGESCDGTIEENPIYSICRPKDPAGACASALIQHCATCENPLYAESKDCQCTDVGNPHCTAILCTPTSQYTGCKRHCDMNTQTDCYVDGENGQKILRGYWTKNMTCIDLGDDGDGFCGFEGEGGGTTAGPGGGNGTVGGGGNSSDAGNNDGGDSGGDSGGADGGTDGGTNAGDTTGTDGGTTTGTTGGSQGSTSSRNSTASSRRSSVQSSSRRSSSSSAASSRRSSASAAAISSRAASSVGNVQSSAAACTPAGRSCSDCVRRMVCQSCNPGDIVCTQSCKRFRYVFAYPDGTSCTACTLEEMQNEPATCPASANSSRGNNSTGSAGSGGAGSSRPGSGGSSALSSRSTSSLRTSGASSALSGTQISSRSGSSRSGSQRSDSSRNTSGSSRNSSENFSSLSSRSSLSSDPCITANSLVRAEPVFRGQILYASSSNSSQSLSPCSSSGNNPSAGSSTQSSRNSSLSRSSARSSSYGSSRRSSTSSITTGGICSPDDCINGGDAVCASGGMTCATINDFPCIMCIGGSSRSSNSASARSSSTSSRSSLQSSVSSSRRSSSSSRRSSGGNSGDDGGNDGGDNGGNDGGNDGGDNGGNDSGAGGNTSDVWFCGDGILTGSEQCDDGNEQSGDGCSARCVWEVMSCNGDECNEGGNAVCASFGQFCVTTNTSPCIQCVNKPGDPGTPLCDGNACGAGGNSICGDYGMKCTEDNENPCFVCDTESGTSSVQRSSSATIVVMNCTGRECSDGGDNVCSAFGLTCTESGDIPCISCVNSIQNVIQPSCAKDGCAIGGNEVCNTQGLGCMPSKTGACFVCTNKEGTMIAQASPFICGNGRVEPGEQCDDGALNSDAPNATCRTNCRAGSCGDGILDTPLEICDDGNMRNDDGCSQVCQRERGAPDTATLPGQVIELPFLPGNGSVIGSVTNPSGVAPSTPLPASTPDTGPAAIAVMAAGAAAGYSWMRKRRS